MSTRSSNAPNGGQRTSPSAPPSVRDSSFRPLRSGQGNTKGKDLAVKGKC